MHGYQQRDYQEFTITHILSLTN